MLPDLPGSEPHLMLSEAGVLNPRLELDLYEIPHKPTPR